MGEDKLSDKEVEHRMNAALKRALTKPHKPHAAKKAAEKPAQNQRGGKPKSPRLPV